jgi:pyridoxal phosphate enzyme (YggS family)
MAPDAQQPVLDSTLLQRLRERLAAVEQRIAAACERAGRARSEVTLVAVTKTVGVEVTACLPTLGVVDLGENRPQELWRKAATVPKAIRWHMIGHLQRNKVERTLPLAHMIHAVDSMRLIEAIETQGREVDVLLEVNASGEASKHGFAPYELLNSQMLHSQLSDLKHVRIQGLMTMAALQDPEACRPTFRYLRNLRERLRSLVPPIHTLKHLSMGMSNDFEVAIEEGATIIRLGSVLFEGITS